MSSQQALEFLRALREDSSLRARIGPAQDALTLRDLVALGTAHGWTFDEDELCRAFRHDWGMRWAHMHAASSRS